MKKYKIVNITGSFGIFLDDEVEAVDKYDAMEQICNEIMDNLGNHIDIELEEVESDEDEPDEDEPDKDEPDYHEMYENFKLEEEFEISDK